MVTPGPDQPSHGHEYPPLENSPHSVDPYAPVDYPSDTGLPPPVYSTPPGYGYPPPPSFPQYPAGYPYAYDPYQSMRPAGTNGKAIASLVTSLVGLVCCGVTAIVGVFLGVIAMRETKQTGQEGRGLALAGVIVGGVVVAGWALYFLVFIVIAATSGSSY